MKKRWKHAFSNIIRVVKRNQPYLVIECRLLSKVSSTKPSCHRGSRVYVWLIYTKVINVFLYAQIFKKCICRYQIYQKMLLLCVNYFSAPNEPKLPIENVAQLAGAVEYSDCFSEEGCDSHREYPWNDSKRIRWWRSSYIGALWNACTPMRQREVNLCQTELFEIVQFLTLEQCSYAKLNFLK